MARTSTRSLVPARLLMPRELYTSDPMVTLDAIDNSRERANQTQVFLDEMPELDAETLKGKL